MFPFALLNSRLDHAPIKPLLLATGPKFMIPGHGPPNQPKAGQIKLNLIRADWLLYFMTQVQVMIDSLNNSSTDSYI
jgi:hypothetical protein